MSDELKLYVVPDETENQSTPVTSNDVSSAIDEQLRNVDVPVVLKSNDIRSTNFVTGSTGWQVTAAGNAEFNAGTFRGALVANSIDIPDTTTANSFHTDNQGNSWWGATTFGAAIASISKAGAAIFTSLTIAGYALISKGTFGGNGSEADPAITSGTTTVSLGGASTFVKNYTALSITGTGALAFSSPHANGTTIILKSQGAVTLTSSAAACIDTSGMGAQGAINIDGVNPNAIILATNNPYGLTTNNSTGAIGGKQFDMPNFYTTSAAILARRYIALICGASGGGGQTNTGSAATGGSGGGALLIECAGTLNFTGTISVSGTNGAAGGNGTPASRGGGGGGGGSTATCVILYNAQTAISGTITAAGGAGGKGGDSTGTGGTLLGGASGAGSLQSAGGAGGNSSSIGSGGNNGSGGGGGGGATGGGGTGAAGGAASGSVGGLVALNTYFA